MVVEDGERSVGLFGEDDSGQFVGQGDAPEGEEEVGVLAGGGGPTVGWAYGEEEALGSLVAEGGEAGGEVFGGELLAAAIEEDGVGADSSGGLLEGLEESGF